jgi:transposase InsO family protein
MLRSFTVIDPHLVNLIRENPRYTKMTPEEILGKFVSGRMMVKEARYVDDALNGPMPIYELQPVALKATSSRETLPSKVAQVEAAGLNEDEMALIIKRFETALKGRKEYPNKNKTRGKRSCFKCGKTGHFIAQCLDNENNQGEVRHGKKEKKKSYRKAKGEAHLGKEWDSDCSSSDSDDEGLAASAFNKSSLFPNERHTCLMDKEKKVYASGGSSWIIDNGCTNHMTGEKKMFTSYVKNKDSQDMIIFGDGNQGKVKGLGKIAITSEHSISNVFLVESLGYNLLSVSQLCHMGYNCLFTNVDVSVFRRSDGSLAFKGALDGKLYLVDFSNEEVDLDACLIAKTSMGWLWHRRLAHVGMKNLHKLLKGEHVLGLTNVCFEKDRPCAACQAGKQVGSTHHNKNVITTSRPLELLHMDHFGPVAYLGIGGSKYGIVIVDDFSRFTWVFFLQDKIETQGTLKRFLRWAQDEFELKVKKIRSNNGSEFKNLQVEEFLEEEGIKHKFFAPYIPQQNGVVERKNMTLIDMARTMLGEFKTPEQFWSEAVNTACHAINRLYL